MRVKAVLLPWLKRQLAIGNWQLAQLEPAFQHALGFAALGVLIAQPLLLTANANQNQPGASPTE